MSVDGAQAFIGRPIELHRWSDVIKSSGTDMLTIPGRDCHDDYGLRQWGPYDLLNRMVRQSYAAAVLFVSVGAGPICGTLRAVPREISPFFGGLQVLSGPRQPEMRQGNWGPGK